MFKLASNSKTYGKKYKFFILQIQELKISNYIKILILRKLNVIV